MSENYHNYQLLLAKAARLYERHGVGRPELLHTKFRRKYMDALKTLVEQDDNIALVEDLYEAVNEAREQLQKKLWQVIEAELESELSDIERSDVPYTRRSKVALCYQLNERISLEIGRIKNDTFWFGIGCSRDDYGETYDMLRDSLREVIEGQRENRYFPWWNQYKLNLNDPKHFKRLSSDTGRRKLARKFVQDVNDVLEVIEDIGIANAIEEGLKSGLASREEVFKILRNEVEHEV